MRYCLKNILAHCHHCFSTFFSIRQKENSILLKTKAEWLKGFSCRIIQVYYILRGIKNNKKKSNENKGSWQMKSLKLHWLIKPQFTSKTLLPIHIALETKRLFRDHENTHLRPSRLYRNLTTNVDWLLSVKIQNHKKKCAQFIGTQSLTRVVSRLRAQCTCSISCMMTQDKLQYMTVFYMNVYLLCCRASKLQTVFLQSLLH